MSDVHRWTTAGGIEVVAATDHDAEIESLRSLLALWEQVWDALNEMGAGLGDANKPVAVTASWALLRSRLAAADRRCECPNCCGGAAADHRHDKHGTHCPDEADLRKILGEKHE
jgi:hypothetical protein